MKSSLHCILACAVLAATGAAQAQDLTVISFGGATKAAQDKAYFKPFDASGAGKVIAGEYNGEMAKVKAMVDTNSVTWDLVEVESPELARGCDEGMFEEIDPAILGKAEDYVPGAVSNCGVGFFVWSTVLAYNADKLKTAPTGWADFWDLKKYPGKRGLRKGAKYTLEVALLADGVPADKLYPLDLDRAFKKLDSIKKDIVWWGGGAQSQQLLASGEATMGQFWNGRIYALQQDGAPVGVSWKQNLVMADFLVVPKGSKNKDAAMKFLAEASSAKGQADFANLTAYAPVNLDSVGQLKGDLAPNLPTAYAKDQITLDYAYWAKNGPAIAARWNEWLVK